jgi:hypothetical protein
VSEMGVDEYRLKIKQEMALEAALEAFERTRLFLRHLSGIMGLMRLLQRLRRSHWGEVTVGPQ